MSRAAAVRTGLWHHADFNRLWGGQTISQLGTQVGQIALPLTAVLALGATPAQMGLLAALGRLPFLLYLVAGAWVDRLRRRPVLVVADLARAAVLAAVPLAAWLHALRIELLFGAALLVTSLTVWFDVAYQSYLPAIVPREELVDANSRLELSTSTAQVAGPSLGGTLVQALGAPLAVLADAASYVVSAAAVLAIRAPEPVPQRRSRPGLRGEIGAGLRFVFGHPTLRLLAIAVCVGNVAWAVQTAVYLLFASRELRLPPAAIGLVVAAAGPGALLGTLLAARLLRRLGLGPTLIAAQGTFGIFSLAIPLAPASPAGAAAVLAVAQFMTAAGFQVSAINYVTLRQVVSPPELLGRVNATFRFAALGLSSVGSLLGGALGSALGLRAALLAGGLGLLVGPCLFLLSPVRRIRGATPDI